MTSDRDRIAEIIRNARMNANPLSQVGYAEADALLANGFILPPCKVGDTVYRPSKYLGYVVPFVIISFEATQSEMFYTDDSDNIIYIGEIGKTVFLTKEEAEKVLAERSGNNG